MLSATVKDEESGFERLDSFFVKDEYKNEIATTTDKKRALSNTVVYEELLQKNRFVDIYKCDKYDIDMFLPFARSKFSSCVIACPNVEDGYMCNYKGMSKPVKNCITQANSSHTGVRGTMKPIYENNITI